MESRTFTVTGMSCGGCEDNVESNVQDMGDVDSVEADHESDTVEVVAAETVSDDDLAAAIRDAGYEVES